MFYYTDINTLNTFFYHNYTDIYRLEMLYWKPSALLPSTNQIARNQNWRQKACEIERGVVQKYLGGEIVCWFWNCEIKLFYLLNVIEETFKPQNSNLFYSDVLWSARWLPYWSEWQGGKWLDERHNIAPRYKMHTQVK